MKTKKILLTILSVVMLFALTAFAVSCKNGGNTDSSVSVSDSGVSSASDNSSSEGKEFETVLYSVEYYLQKVTGDGYERKENPKNLSAKAGETVNAEIKSFAHFTHVQKTDSLESAAAVKNLVLKVYYDRDKYTLTLSSEDDSATVTGAGEYYYGATADITASKVLGYVFAGWKNVDGEVKYKNGTASVLVDGDISLIATYRASTDTVYAVEYYFENVTGDGYDFNGEYSSEETGETDADVEVAPENVEHFVFDEENDNNVLSAKIKADGSTVLKLYYTRNKHTVDITVPDVVDELTGDGEHYYGSSVSVTMKSVGGFTFLGWYENVAGEETLISTSANFTLTDHIDRDYVIYSKWSQEVYIGSVSQPLSLNLYETNSAPKEIENIRNEFAYRDNPYYVGDDNAFSIKPVVTFMDEDQEDVATPHSTDYEDAWLYNVALYEKNDLGNYVKVNADQYDDYLDNLDRIACKIDFSTDAVGKDFRISIYPSGLTERQLAKLSERYSTTIEISVIDGYNVTQAKELAYFNNVGDYDTGKGGVTNFNAGARWLAYREEKGLDPTLSPKALILHNDITLTDADVPSEYFYSEAEVAADSDKEIAAGSLKDRMDLFFRYIPEGETFIFEGNYFTLDCSKLSLVVRAEGDPYDPAVTLDSHSQLMRMYSDDAFARSFGTIRNINLKGNAEKTEETQKSGGLILIKGENVKFEALNNISNCWYINYMTDYSKKNFKVSYCRAYDSFNCIMYVWGGTDVVIDHCDFNGAGGPVFIVDHVHPENDDITTGTPSCVKVNDSHIHSFVTGREAWFNMFKGAMDLATQIKGIGATLNAGGRTITVKNSKDSSIEYLDIVAVYKSGEAEGLTTALVTGYYGTEGSINPMDFGTYGQVAAGTYSDSAKTPLRTFIDYTISKESVLMVSNAATLDVSSGAIEGAAMYAIVPEYGINGLLDSANNPVAGYYGGQLVQADTNKTIFQGDQMYVYIYNGMSVVFNYYNYGDTVDPTDIGALIKD